VGHVTRYRCRDVLHLSARIVEEPRASDCSASPGGLTLETEAPWYAWAAVYRARLRCLGTFASTCVPPWPSSRGYNAG
jgi:hypothetical protein